MEKETVTAAPQAYVTDDYYEVWLETHTGTKEDFVRFLCEPSTLRTEFLLSQIPLISIAEGVGTATYNA